MAERFFVKARGLPWEAVEKDLIDFFSNSSVVNGEKGVTIVKNYDGRSSGTAYIEVASEDDVKAALAKDRMKIGRRYIEVFEATQSQVENEMGSMQKESADDDAVVRLRGLPYSATKADIEEFFSGLEIESNGVLMISDFQGRSKGECFVQFTNVADAIKALEKNRCNIGHRYIEVFASSMNDAQMTHSKMIGSMGGMGGPMRGGGAMGGMRPGPYDRFMGGGGGRGGYGMMRGGGMGMSMGMGGGMRGGRGGPGGPVIKMRGLPYEVSEQEIAEWFSSVADPVDIHIKFNGDGRPSGDALVAFATEGDANRAMQKNKQNMKHRYIELFYEG